MQDEDGLFIFGHVMSVSQIEEDETQLAILDGVPRSQAEQEGVHTAGIEAMHRLSGRAYGRCHSIAETMGEYGPTPIDTMIEITKEQFEQAEKYSWNVDLMLAEHFDAWRDTLTAVILLATGFNAAAPNTSAASTAGNAAP